ncbi:MAG TPA: hypothetical protein VJY33_10440 [Isosphaeraceae bacterium]|nr:hypothetical protein [Isosphaeraceae bacterium]
MTDAPASELAARSSPMRPEDGPSRTRGLDPAAPETPGKVTTPTPKVAEKLPESSPPAEERLVGPWGSAGLLACPLALGLCWWWGLAKPGTAR